MFAYVFKLGGAWITTFCIFASEIVFGRKKNGALNKKSSKRKWDFKILGVIIRPNAFMVHLQCPYPNLPQ